MMRPLLEDIIREHILIHEQTGDIEGFEKTGLDALAVSTLKVAYREIIDFVAATNSGDKKGKHGIGLIEHYKLKLYTPTTTGKTIYADKNGSFFKLADEMKRYHERISYRINEFMYKPKTWKSKRDYGMNDIYQELHDLADLIPLKQRRKIQAPVSLFVQ